MLKEYQIVIFIPSIENGGVEKNLELISNYLAKKKEINLSIITAFKNNNFIFKKKIKFYTFNSKFNLVELISSIKSFIPFSFLNRPKYINLIFLGTVAIN